MSKKRNQEDKKILDANYKKNNFKKIVDNINYRSNDK